MDTSAKKTPPPTKYYTRVNGFCGLLWAIGIPVLFWMYFHWPLWIKIPVVIVWLVLSGRVVDRHIPRVTNPVIEWVYDRFSNKGTP